MLYYFYNVPLCRFVLATPRLLLFAAAYETTLTLEPPLITLIILFILGGTGGMLSFNPFEFLSFVARLRFERKSLRCPCLRSYATSNRRACHLYVWWPWSWWNLHHFLMSQMSGEDFILRGHFTVSPILFSTLTSLAGSMLKLYSSNFGLSCARSFLSYDFLESLNYCMFSIRRLLVG